MAVQGAGHVGASLAGLLAQDGAQVFVADVDAARAQRVAAEVGGRAIDAGEILRTPCDVLAPCAVARVISDETLPALCCRIVAGAANDPLAEPRIAGELAAQGITYVPDFIANAGGVVHIQALRAAWDEAQLRGEVLRIGRRVSELLTDAAATGTTPLAAAEALARARVRAAARSRLAAGFRARPQGRAAYAATRRRKSGSTGGSRLTLFLTAAPWLAVSPFAAPSRLSVVAGSRPGA